MILNEEKCERSKTLATRATCKRREVKSKGRWHYLAVAKLSALSRGIESKNNGDFYCLDCLHSSRTKRYLNRIKKYVKIKIFVM